MQSEAWRRNLYLVAISEFIALLGFSLFNPFMPLYVQKLGDFGSGEAALWAGIAAGGSGVAMFLSSPVWGILADRRGRKPMLLRAQFGGAIIIGLFILAPNIYVFVALRTLQGLFTGTVTAAAALVAGGTPRDKLPYSMGVLMGAVFGGVTLGPLVGGLLADTFTFEVTFAITSTLLAVGGAIILVLVKENFTRPTVSQPSPFRSMLRLAFSREVLPLLMVVAVLNLGPQIVNPVLPLVIRELTPNGAATAAGAAIALMGLVTAISSLTIGRLHRRFSVRKILVVSCIGSGLLYLPPIWANSELQLILLIGLTGVLTGGIVTSSNSLVSLTVPLAQQGLAYGLSQSANSLGMAAGPFIGGGLAPLVGLRPIFGIAAGIFVLVGFLVVKLIPDRSSSVTKESANA